MSRNFVAASSQYLHNASPLKSGQPFTLFAWFKPSNLVGNSSIAGMFGTAAQHYFWLFHDATSLYFAIGDGSTIYAMSTGTVADGVWQSACGRANSAASWDCFLNGANKGSDTTSKTPTVSTTQVGRRSFADDSYFDGEIAYVALWDIALSDGEIAQLHAGAFPDTIQVGNLTHYYPLAGTASPETDEPGTLDLTVVGATQGGSNPPVGLKKAFFLLF